MYYVHVAACMRYQASSSALCTSAGKQNYPGKRSEYVGTRAPLLFRQENSITEYEIVKSERSRGAHGRTIVNLSLRDANFRISSRELHRSVREVYSSSYALYRPSANRSFPQIDQSYYRRHRPQGRPRRWKLTNCFRRTSSDIPSSRDAPPTYSSMHINLISNRQSPFPINNQSSVVMRIPPPSYAQAQEIDLAVSTVQPFVTLSPSTRSSWPRVPTAAICPRCSTLIITAVITRRSTYTHLTALTLFLFGCWPCCMIPYCIDSCNNMDHHCPVCHMYLGTYVPC